VNTAEIDLINTGKVEFDFVTLDAIEGDGESIKPCQLDVSPFKVKRNLITVINMLAAKLFL